MSKEITELTIKRSKWIRGKGQFMDAMCQKSEGKQETYCAMGFVGRAVGIRAVDLAEMGEPCDSDIFCTKEEKDNIVKRWPSWVLMTHHKHYDDTRYDNRKIVKQIIRINDDQDLSDASREKKLIALFKKVGITLRFE